MTTLDFIGKSFLNGHGIVVTSEDSSLDVTIPQHRIEKGIKIADHVEREPIVVKISGVLTRPTPAHLEGVVEAFYRWEEIGRLNTYEGRRIYKNMLMHGLRINATPKMLNGYEISFTLEEMDVADQSYIPPQAKSLSASGQQQTKNQKTGAIYHTVKKGDTYWGLSKKYGASINQLRTWNSYPDTKIPVGAKLRVK